MSKYYLLTILKKEGDDNKLYANVYDSVNSLKKAYKEFKEKYPLRFWELVETESSEFDVVLAGIDGNIVACLGPKGPLPEGKNLIKCLKKEVNIEDL